MRCYTYDVKVEYKAREYNCCLEWASAFYDTQRLKSTTHIYDGQFIREKRNSLQNEDYPIPFIKN